MKMICLVSPTDYTQRIYVFDGRIQVTYEPCSGLMNFYKNLFNLAAEYNIKDIDFEGRNITYLEGIRRAVYSQEMNMYGAKRLNISIKEFIPDEIIEEN